MLSTTPTVQKRHIRYTETIQSNTSLTIKCNDISNNGSGSSYEPHIFSLDKKNENVSNFSWRFLLKNKQGEYTQIANGNTENFTIDKVSLPDNFYININGDLEGRIECDYSLNGQRYNAVPFSFSLELKPIISIDNISTVDTGDSEFSLSFDVKYAGADYVSVEIEEEYNTTLRNYRFDEPYIAHVKIGNITNLYYSWVTIIVSNKYGTTSKTLEYEPTFDRENAESLVKEVKYNYQLFSGSVEKLDCKGDLYLSMSLPENTSRLIFERSKPRLINPALDQLRILSKGEIPVGENHTIHNIPWGTYFRIRAILADGTDVCSPIYSTNDYMSKVDLDALISSASVENVDIDDIKLYIEDKQLYVYTSEILSLSAFDMSGRQIFNGNIHQSMVIPLNNIISPFIIVKYSTSDTIKVKKMLVK